MQNYLRMRDQLNTGDIVLFSGRSPLARLGQCVSQTKWIHIGMVLRCDWGVFLWESDLFGHLKDLQSGKIRGGVRMVALSDRVKRYDGEAWVRPLKVGTTPLNLQALSDLIEEVRGCSYERHYIQLIKAYWGGLVGQNTEDLSSLFCSELVAEAYQRMGVFAEPPEGRPSNAYTPIDFSEERDISPYLLNKATLGKAFRLEP
jgi:hypothetical protein